MATEIKEEVPKDHPALTGFSALWEKVKHVGKTVGVIALKGAVIGGVVLGVVAALTLGPAGGIFSGILNTLGSFVGVNVGSHLGMDAIIALATKGLALGGIAGAAIGLAKGVGEADDVAEDVEQSLITKYNRAQQFTVTKQAFDMKLNDLQAQRMAPQGGMGMTAGQMQPPLPTADMQNGVQNQNVGWAGTRV